MVLPTALYIIATAVRTFSETSQKFNPPHFVTGITMVVMWLSWFALNDEDPFKYIAPPFLNTLGIALLIIGSVVFAIGVITLMKGLIKKQLVSSFLFSKIRHPMYYGMILWLLGYPLFASSTTGLLAGPAGIVCILIWRHTEEKACLENLHDYADYMKNTWF